MSTGKKISDIYYHGVGCIVADELNVTEKYVRDVLRGTHDTRTTKTVKNIKKAAEKFKKPQADN